MELINLSWLVTWSVFSLLNVKQLVVGINLFLIREAHAADPSF
jgi:hypothetical protein